MRRKGEEMKKHRIISSLVLVVFVFLSLISASVAWLANFITAHTEGEFSGSSIASYFADGSGKADDPYIISNAKHLYNLAWLQNKDALGEEKTYFKVCKIVGSGDDIQHVPTTIDMAGAIFGTDEEGRSGAIPPIGTAEKPFLGYFDGFGSTISNLWVSTVKNDWKEQPEGVEDYDSDYVGLFGAIGGEAIVEDFILDRVEIKSHLPDAKIGIVCGYVDAMIKNVGVYNGIINVAVADGSAVKSDYSLIGEKNARIIWDDMPEIDSNYEEDVEGGDDAGGAIKIDPNDSDFPTLGSSSYVKVPDSADDRAFIVGTSFSESSQTVNSTYYIYPATIKSRTDAGNTFGTSKSEFATFTRGDYYVGSTKMPDGIEINEDFKAVLGKTVNEKGKNVNIQTIQISRAPERTGTVENGIYTSVTLSKDYDKDGVTDTLNIPTDSIWFKPVAEGNCVISFTVSNMSGSNDKYRSIYRFNRDENGNIQNWAETKLTFKNTGDKFGNKDLLVFQYYIEKADIDEKYEFIIGASHDPEGNPINDTSISFLFLALAGASNTGGGEDSTVTRPTEPGEFATIMYDLDYVVVPTGSNIAADTYSNHNSLIRIEAVPNGGKIYYLAAGTENTVTNPNNSKVYYCLPSGTTNEEVFDIAKPRANEQTAQSALVNKGDTFASTTFKERKEIR